MHTPKTMNHRDTQTNNLILWPVFWQGVTAKRNRNRLLVALTPPWWSVVALGVATLAVILLTLAA